MSRTSSEPRAHSRQGPFPAPRIALAIARVELRRSLRALRSHDYALIGAVVFGIPVLLALLAAFQIGQGAGEAVAAGDSAAVGFGRTLFVGGFLFLFVMYVVTGLGQYGSIDNEAGMLTIRPAKDVAGGLLVSWCVTYWFYLFLPVAAGFAGIAVGADSPFPLVGALLGTVAATVAAGALGFPLGLLGKGVRRRTPWFERALPVVGAVVFVLYIWVAFTGRWITALEALEPVLDGPPLGWFADLAFVTTTGADASVSGAAGALLLTVVVGLLGTLATVRAAAYAWHADPQEPEPETNADERSATDRIATAGSRALGALTRRRGTHGIAIVVWLRAARSPMQLLYGLLPLVVGIPMFEQLYSDGSLPWYAPWLVVLLGAWVAGETFPLNLLGNQGATLPTLLTSRADGRVLLHGYVLAVAVPLVPVTATLAVGAGLVAGATAFELVALALAGGGAVIGGAVLGAGFGALFPRFDTLTVGGAVEVAVPSKRAVLLFSLVISLGTVAVALATDEMARELTSFLFAEFVPYLSPAADTLELVGILLILASLGSVVLAYRGAIARIDRFRVS